MPTLYITEQGASLRKEQNRLVVERDGVAIVQVHDFKVDRVVVFGNVQLTTPALTFLLDRGIDTAFLTMSGRLKGRLAPLESRNVPLRLAQYDRVRDTRFALGFSRSLVAAKITNCAELLARHQRNHPECDLTTGTRELIALKKRIEAINSVDTLRGIEGQAGAVYFKGFARMLRRDMRFEKRTRRPPKDPVNSLLSFGYTLLYNEAIAVLSAMGFEPYLGFYHKIRYGRCSLALDLIEELRPVMADRLALNLVNLEIIKSSDFERGNGHGVLLKQDGRKRFLREYEQMMTGEFTNWRTRERTSLRRVLFDQALSLQGVILDGEPYKAFQGWR